jgi:hypothetical protein
MAVCGGVLLVVGCGNEPALPAPEVRTPKAAPLAPITSVVADPLVVARIDELGLAEVELPALDAEAPPSQAGYQGPAPRVIADSASPIDQSSPERALRGALDAIARSDAAALARLRRSPAKHPRLTEDDAADAQRRFLSDSMAPTWKRISQALQRGAYEVISSTQDTTGPTKVVVVLQVGGALGSYRLSLYKDGDAWFMS